MQKVVLDCKYFRHRHQTNTDEFFIASYFISLEPVLADLAYLNLLLILLLVCNTEQWKNKMTLISLMMMGIEGCNLIHLMAEMIMNSLVLVGTVSQHRQSYNLVLYSPALII